MKFFLVSALAVVASQAFASFEMMLLATSDGIMRYDPINRVNLGTFGVAQFHEDVAIDPTNIGQCLTVTAYGISRYDYNSGMYLGGFALSTTGSVSSPRIHVLSTGNLLVVNQISGDTNPEARIYSPTGALITTIATTGAVFDAIQGPTGGIHVLTRRARGANWDFVVQNFGSSGTGLSSSTSVITDNSGEEAVGTLGVVGSQIFSNAGRGSGVFYTMRFNPSATTATQVQSTNQVVPPGFTNWVGGHNGSGFMIKSSYNSTTQRHYNAVYGFLPSLPRVNLDHAMAYDTGAVYASAIVVAPEPGTIIALGIGLAAIARRKKR